MSRNDYSFSPSGGLMPLIQALIRPPDSRESSRQANKKPQHPYYRRPGRGHNRNSCDACREGGDLICCDRCPASFHLGCHDPPLSEEDIPAGLWLCHMCRMTQNQRKPNATKSTTSSDETNAQFDSQKFSESRPSTPITSDGVINAAKIRLGHKRSSSRVSSSSEHSLCIIDKELKVKIQRIDADNFTNGTETIEQTMSNSAENHNKIEEEEVQRQIEIQQQQLEPCPDTKQDSCKNENDNIANDVEEITIDNNSCQILTEETTTTTTITIESTANSESSQNVDEMTTESNHEAAIADFEDLVKIESSQNSQFSTNSFENTQIMKNMEEPEDSENTENAENAEKEENVCLSNDDLVQNENENEIVEPIPTEEDDALIEMKTPFDELIRAASILNPRQFELPRQFNIYPQFPGDEKVSNETSKSGSKKNNNRNGSNGNGNGNRIRHELDSQGLVPLPAATCFYCRRSCKKAPLIACDYCPLFFHQDCLDPPLTALPTSLWMCPNHPEQFVDWKLVTSISATERIKLWNQFGGPVDQETIKADFVRKVHCKNPPFRFKVKPKPRHCAEIPPMVEFHYKNPPPLLPSLRDVLRCERVYREYGFPSSDLESHDDELEKDLHELQEANKKLQELEASITHVEDQQNEPNPNEDHTVDDKSESKENVAEKEEAITVEVGNIVRNTIEMENDEKAIEKIENETHLIEESESNSNKYDDNDIETLNSESTSDTLINENDRSKSNRRRKRNTSTKSFGECDDLIELSEEVFKAKSQKDPTNDVYSAEAIDEQLNGLDINVIKKLAFIQLQKILNENPEMVAKHQGESANKAIKDALAEKPVPFTLPSQLLTKEDIARIAEEFNSSNSSSEALDSNISEPAYAGVPQPIAPLPQKSSDCYVHLNGLENIQNDRERALAIAQRLERPLQESKIRARAVLTPVGDILAGKKWYTNSHTDDSIFMRYRSLVIGTGPNCDLQMKCMRNCARFSPHHATIFYDEITKLYELLNYSEHGTEVNGQLYSLDFTEYPELNENRKKDVNGFYKNIREIIDKKRGAKRVKYGIDENARMAAPNIAECRCQAYPPLVKGWEGSAVLTHGSLLRFGCLAYVFSIIDNMNDEND